MDLVECSDCKHIWIIQKVIPYSYYQKKGHTVCPKCLKFNLRVKYTHIDDNAYLYLRKLPIVTFIKSNFWCDDHIIKYPKDTLLKLLNKNKFLFKRNESSSYCVYYYDTNNNFVLINYSRKNKMSHAYLGFKNNNDPLIKKIIDAIKEDKRIKKEFVPPTKPIIESIKDAIGYDVTVGDWVAHWSTKSLGFGKVKSIESFSIYGREDIGIKVQRYKQTSQIKTSDQFVLISPEKSMLLELER